MWKEFENQEKFDSLCETLDLDYYIGYHKEEQIKNFGLFNSKNVHLVNLTKDTSVSNANSMYADVCLLYYIWKNPGQHNFVAMNHYHRYFDITKMDNLTEPVIKSMQIIKLPEPMWYHFQKHQFESNHERWMSKMFEDYGMEELLEKRGYKYNFKNDNILMMRESFICSREVFDKFMTEFDDFLQELWKIKGKEPPEFEISRYIFEELVSVIMHNVASNNHYNIIQGNRIMLRYE